MKSEKDCDHWLIFRELVRSPNKWYCRTCFKEIDKETMERKYSGFKC